MSQIIKYSLNIVFRRKLRTFLTSLGITISVVLLSFIIFGMRGLENALIQEFTARFDPDDVTVMKSGAFGGLLGDTQNPAENDVEKETVEVINQEVVSRIENYKYVREVMPIMMIFNLDIYVGEKEKPYTDNNVVGFDASGEDSFFLDYEEVTLSADEPLKMGQAYISKMVAHYYDLDAEQLVGEVVRLEPSRSSFMSSPSKSVLDKSYELEIVGIADSGQDRMSVVMSLDQSEEIVAEMGGFDTVEEMVREYGYWQLQVKSEEGQSSKVKQFVEDEFGLMALTADDFLSFIKILTNGLTLALVLFGFVSAFVASIGIINTMVMSIYEQTREIGIIKAIGASNIQVLCIFLIQSAMIGLIGGAVGVLFVMLVIHFLDPVIVELLVEQGFALSYFFAVEAGMVSTIVFSSILVGIVAGVYPSIRASKLDPVRALRHE